jgi:hypothetical protein
MTGPPTLSARIHCPRRQPRRRIRAVAQQGPNRSGRAAGLVDLHESSGRPGVPEVWERCYRSL